MEFPGWEKYEIISKIMILKINLPAIILLSIVNVMNLPSSAGKGKSAGLAEYATFPDSIECIVKPYYRHRADGKPGREVILHLTGQKYSGKGTVKLESGSICENVPIDAPAALDSLAVILPAGVGVNSEAVVTFTITNGKKQITTNVTIPPKRQWTVYIYPHSHVDIGYTNTHGNVELIHKRNPVYGIDLASLILR